MATDFSPQSHGQRPPPSRGHEASDAKAGWIFGSVAFLVLCGVIIHLVLAGILKTANQRPMPTDDWSSLSGGVSKGPAQPPFPRLQVAPPVDLAAFRAREEALLNSYGWVDRTSGLVRIPIERAMDLLLEQGLPVRSATNGARVGPSSYELEQQRAARRQPEVRQR